MKLSIILPVYNDEKKILSNLSRIKRRLDNLKIDYELIVVDDGSDDKTYELIDNAGYKVLFHMYNKGKGAAFVTGFKEVSGEYVALLDSDNQIDIDDLKSFFTIMEIYNADCVIGNKRHEYSCVTYSPVRWVVSNIYNLICRMLFGIRLRDTQCGMKLFKKEALDRVMQKVLVKRFAFDLEILVALKENKLRVADAPVCVRRQYGSGSVSIKNILDTLKDTLAVWYRKKKGWYFVEVHDQRELDTGE